MRTGVIAKKVGMTRLFQDDGRHVPVTVLALEGNQVIARRDDGSLQRSAAPFPTLWPTLTMVTGLAHILPDHIAPRVGTRWSHGQSWRQPAHASM